MRSIYKIIHTTCHTGWGGLEKRILNESLWMRENGHTVILAAPKETPLLLRAKENGFKTYPVEFKRLSALKDYRFLKHMLANERPDIINTHGNKDSKLALYAAKKAGVPCRILSRHISAHVRNSWYNRILYKKLCHYIFTTADTTTRHLKKVFKLKDMQVFSMPSGITPPETLMDKETARTMLAKELKLDPETRFIGFIGRVSKDKGVDILIRAFADICNSLAAYHLVIVGDGTDTWLEELNTLAEKLKIKNRVHFTGFREDVWTCYRALECKVLPSRNIKGIPFEGVPQSLLEAMYCECPVVASDSGGIVDIVEHGKTGLLFSAEDAGGLGDKIRESLTRNKAAMLRAETACKKTKKQHTIDAMGRDIIRIYRLHQVKLERSPY